MLSLPSSIRIFVCREPTDMRKSFDGLAAIVAGTIHQSPQSGHLFVFPNRARTMLKILVWDSSGYWVLSKRLEHGRFCFLDRPASPSGAYEVRASELMQIIDGIDLRGAKRRFDHRDFVEESKFSIDARNAGT